MRGIVVYGASWCAPCKTLTWWLDKNGYKYTYRDADEEPWTTEQLEVTNGQRTLPTVVINDHVIVGLNIAAVSKALDQ